MSGMETLCRNSGKGNRARWQDQAGFYTHLMRMDLMDGFPDLAVDPA